MRRAPIADDAKPGEPSLVARQAGVATGALPALVVTALMLAMARPPTGERPALIVWAIAALGPLFSLVIAVGALANRRFFAAQDIDAAAGGPPSDAARVAQAIIQNTLEQAMLALSVYALLAIVLPKPSLGVIWAMSAAFVVGRLAFAIGYRFGAGGRAFGFGLTFYPTVAGLVWAALRLMA